MVPGLPPVTLVTVTSKRPRRNREQKGCSGTASRALGDEITGKLTELATEASWLEPAAGKGTFPSTRQPGFATV